MLHSSYHLEKKQQNNNFYTKKFFATRPDYYSWKNQEFGHKNRFKVSKGLNNLFAQHEFVYSIPLHIPFGLSSTQITSIVKQAKSALRCCGLLAFAGVPHWKYHEWHLHFIFAVNNVLLLDRQIEKLQKTFLDKFDLCLNPQKLIKVIDHTKGYYFDYLFSVEKWTYHFEIPPHGGRLKLIYGMRYTKFYRDKSKSRNLDFAPTNT